MLRFQPCINLLFVHFGVELSAIIDVSCFILCNPMFQEKKTAIIKRKLSRRPVLQEQQNVFLRKIMDLTTHHCRETSEHSNLLLLLLSTQAIMWIISTAISF